jgi:hypothetical protein
MGKKVNQPQPVSKASRKNIYVALGVIAVIAVVSAWGFVFLPQNEKADLLLSYNYLVGENMTYNMTSITHLENNQNTSMTGTFDLLVTGFDGENYTINENTMLHSPGGLSQNVTIQLDKAGYVTVINGSGLFFESFNMFSSLGTFRQESGANVGETWQVPLGGNNVSEGMIGNLTYTFGLIQDIQVPAGTYKVFRLEVSSNNVTEIIHLPAPINETIFTTATLYGTSYLENGTCRLITSHIEGSQSTLRNNETTNETSFMDIQLVNDTRQ